MPLYQWYCPHCTGLMDVVRTLAEYDKPPTLEEFNDLDKSGLVTHEPGSSPEHCGDHKWERRIGPTTFILQGTGWYKTDY